MRPKAQSTVQVDLIGTREELGELAKLGGFLSRDALITAADDEHRYGSKVVLHSREDQWLETEIAALVAICGVVRDRPVDGILAEVRDTLERWGYPVQGKPSDGRPFGSGPERDVIAEDDS